MLKSRDWRWWVRQVILMKRVVLGGMEYGLPWTCDAQVFIDTTGKLQRGAYIPQLMRLRLSNITPLARSVVA